MTFLLNQQFGTKLQRKVLLQHSLFNGTACTWPAIKGEEQQTLREKIMITALCRAQEGNAIATGINKQVAEW